MTFFDFLDVAHVVLNKCMDISDNTKEEDSPDFHVEMKYDFIDNIQDTTGESDSDEDPDADKNSDCDSEYDTDGDDSELNELQPEAMSYLENREYHPLKLMVGSIATIQRA